MYSVWIWTHKEARKHKDVSLKSLMSAIRELRKTTHAHTIEITKLGCLPCRQTLFVCPVTFCGKCPKEIKSKCPMYKIFKDHAKPSNNHEDLQARVKEALIGFNPEKN